MKKRVIIGIVCALLGLAVVFVIGPLVNTASQQTVDALRLRANVGQGSEITASDLEVVQMLPGSIPFGTIHNPNQVIGKYATSDLFAGDYLSAAKLSGTANNADAVFATLDGNKVAISIPISFQGAISGKLENGDVVRFYVKGSGSDESAYTPKSLMYVRIITVTTGSGIDQDERYYNEDGSYDMPITATVLVTDAQARDLVDLVYGSSMYLSLVCPGNSELAQGFLAQQDAILEEMAQAEAEMTAEPNEEGQSGEVVVIPDNTNITDPTDPAQA